MAVLGVLTLGGMFGCTSERYIQEGKLVNAIVYEKFTRNGGVGRTSIAPAPIKYIGKAVYKDYIYLYEMDKVDYDSTVVGSNVKLIVE